MHQNSKPESSASAKFRHVGNCRDTLNLLPKSSGQCGPKPWCVERGPGGDTNPLPASQPFRGRSHYVFDGLNVKTAPIMVDAMPPSRNHTDLCVGVPEKNRDTPEPTEFEASMPQIINAMPTPSSAHPSALFINFI